MVKYLAHVLGIVNFEENVAEIGQFAFLTPQEAIDAVLGPFYPKDCQQRLKEWIKIEPVVIRFLEWIQREGGRPVRIPDAKRDLHRRMAYMAYEFYNAEYAGRDSFVFSVTKEGEKLLAAQQAFVLNARPRRRG